MGNDILEQIKPKVKKTVIKKKDKKESDDNGVEDNFVKEPDEELINTILETFQQYPIWLTRLSCSYAYTLFDNGVTTKFENIQEIYENNLYDLYCKLLSANDSDFITVEGKINNVVDLKIHQSLTIIPQIEPIIPLYDINPYEIKVIDYDGSSRQMEYNMRYIKNIHYLKETDSIGPSCCGCPFLSCNRRTI